MKIKGKTAHAVVTKLSRLTAIRGILRQLAEEEARLVEELDGLISAVADGKNVRSITATEAEVEVQEDAGERQD